MQTKGIINEIDGKLSPEFLGKFSPDQQEELKKISDDKLQELQKLAKKQQEETKQIGKSPTAQIINLNEVRSEQLATINQIFSTSGPKQKIKSKTSGQIVAEHKSKLGFIFIGDSVEDPTVEVNAPKISMVVGGALGTTYNPKTGEMNDIDPESNNLIGVSSQFHLLSLTDIDVKGILPVSTLKKRSSIKTEADALELYGNEIVLIRSLGRPYKSAGARTMTPGGVHIVSGMEISEEKGNQPQPMVLGKALADTLSEIVTKISDINSVLINMNEDLLSLKLSLVSHTHPVFTTGAELAAAVAIATTTGGSAPLPLSTIGTPSITLATQVAPTIATSTVRNITNTYSHLINLEVLKTNSLTPLSSQKFLSDFNRVN